MKRIIVLGRERSGTKWLTNLIANHGSICCVQSERHNGVLETNMFDRMESVFGDLENADNRFAFKQCYAQTGFFRITQLPASLLDEISSTSYARIFVQVMDRFARESGCEGWVQKANSLNAEKIRQQIPDAKLVFIQRDPIDNLLSKTLRFPDQAGFRNNLQHMMGFVYAQKFENRFCRSHPSFQVSFESLKNRKEETVKSICRFAGIEFEPSMLEDQFRKNTTFGTIEKPTLSRSSSFQLRMLHRLITLIPFPVLKGFRNRFGQGSRRKNRFAEGTFEI